MRGQGAVKLQHSHSNTPGLPHFIKPQIFSKTIYTWPRDLTSRPLLHRVPAGLTHKIGYQCPLPGTDHIYQRFCLPRHISCLVKPINDMPPHPLPLPCSLSRTWLHETAPSERGRSKRSPVRMGPCPAEGWRGTSSGEVAHTPYMAEGRTMGLQRDLDMGAAGGWWCHNGSE